MDKIKTYHNREVVWIDYTELLEGNMPHGNWICLATCSAAQPDFSEFEKFTRFAIKNDILEFKGHGKLGELLHDLFDETLVFVSTMENYAELDILTTWHNGESLASTLWECFFASCLNTTTEYSNLKIICTDLDGINRKEELTKYISQFEQGWLPSD